MFIPEVLLEEKSGCSISPSLFAWDVLLVLNLFFGVKCINKLYDVGCYFFHQNWRGVFSGDCMYLISFSFLYSFVFVAGSRSFGWSHFRFA